MNIDPDHLTSGHSWIHRKERRPWSIWVWAWSEAINDGGIWLQNLSPVPVGLAHVGGSYLQIPD